MYFHIIGIKEDESKKYNIDILLEAESEALLKNFLHTHNIVVLNFSEYKSTLDSFWNLEVLIRYRQNTIRAISYLNDISSFVKYLMMIWFDITYANFISSGRISDQDVTNIIQKAFLDAQESKSQITQKLKEQKDQEKKIYKDEKLKKTIKVSLVAIKEAENILKNINNSVSQDKIRDIKIMSQELTKLKMWRNIDKMLEVLENIYHKIYEINHEYILNQDSKSPINWSIITDSAINLEINKYQKAQNIKTIWAKRDFDDNYYLSFEQTGMYFKFLIKDIQNKAKNISNLFFNIFDYFEIFFVFVIVFLSVIFWFQKITYSLSENLYLYVFLTKMWVFGLSFFIVKIFRKKDIKNNLLLFLFGAFLSYFLFLFLKNNLSF